MVFHDIWPDSLCPSYGEFRQLVRQTRHWHEWHSRHTARDVYMGHAISFMSFDVSDSQRFPISQEVIRGVLPYKGLMGTCGQPGYVFRDFCLKQGIDFIIFCLSQGIDLINFCLKQGTFSWTINSLRVCSTNVLNRVSKIRILSQKRVGKSSIFVLNRVRVWGAGPHPSSQKYILSTPPPPGEVILFFFIPSTNFRFLTLLAYKICFKPRRTLNGSQETLLGSFLWLDVSSNK